MVSMVNEMLATMAYDMKIKKYQDESDSSYTYRIIFSALGIWCLHSANDKEIGVSKHAQTLMLNELVDKYIKLFPCLADALADEDINIATFIRTLYEEIGYLITDNLNKNHIATFNRGIDIGNDVLYFGLVENFNMSGLGVFSSSPKASSTWRELLIRDNMDYKTYLDSQYNVVDFYERDLDIQELLFFNPKLNKSPSSSWESDMTTDKTIARQASSGRFYKIMNLNGKLLFSDAYNQNDDSLTSYEYRHLYFALKKYYAHPCIAKLTQLDENYSKIIINAHLPNREYYMMLLCAWPENKFNNKTSFIVKNSYINFVCEILKNLGIYVIGG